MHRFVHDDRFSIIVIVYTNRLHSYCTPITVVFPMSRCHPRTLHVWQSSQPASFSPAGLTLWPSWLERWLAALSGLSVQVRNQWGCRDITLGARPQAWVKLSALIVHSESTDCHVSLWPGENGGLPDRGVWCHWGREECDNPAGLLASRQRVWPFGRVG